MYFKSKDGWLAGKRIGLSGFSKKDKAYLVSVIERHNRLVVFSNDAEQLDILVYNENTPRKYPLYKKALALKESGANIKFFSRKEFEPYCSGGMLRIET